MTKPTKWHVRPAKTQISLDIRFWLVFCNVSVQNTRNIIVRKFMKTNKVSQYNFVESASALLHCIWTAKKKKKKKNTYITNALKTCCFSSLFFFFFSSSSLFHYSFIAGP